MKDELAARYRNYSVAQLLEILGSKKEYTLDAIEVAERELEMRQVTPEQLRQAEEELESKGQAIAEQRDVFAAVGDKAGNFLRQTYQDIHPTTQKSPEKAIKIICGFLGLALLYHIFSNFNFSLSLLGSMNGWDLSVVLWFLPYIFLPATIYFFYIKSPVGWSMLSIWLTFIVMSAVYGYAFEFTLPVPVSDGGILDLLEDFSPRRGLSHYFFVILFFGGMLYFINTKPVKEMFKVNKWAVWLSMGLSALAVTVQWLPLLG